MGQCKLHACTGKPLLNISHHHPTEDSWSPSLQDSAAGEGTRQDELHDTWQYLRNTDDVVPYGAGMEVTDNSIIRDGVKGVRKITTDVFRLTNLKPNTCTAGLVLQQLDRTICCYLVVFDDLLLQATVGHSVRTMGI